MMMTKMNVTMLCVAISMIELVKPIQKKRVHVELLVEVPMKVNRMEIAQSHEGRPIYLYVTFCFN